jgi:carboxylate-amine ligase
VRRLSFNPWQNWDMNAVSRAIIVENKWRAQRYGVHGTFARIEGDGPVTVADMLEVAISEVKKDAEALGCLDEVLHCRRIVADGTSADCQIGIYDQFADNPEHALRQVADWLTETTLQ